MSLSKNAWHFSNHHWWLASDYTCKTMKFEQSPWDESSKICCSGCTRYGFAHSVKGLNYCHICSYLLWGAEEQPLESNPSWVGDPAITLAVTFTCRPDDHPKKTLPLITPMYGHLFYILPNAFPAYPHFY